jgi:hypothetical protein
MEVPPSINSEKPNEISEAKSPEDILPEATSEVKKEDQSKAEQKESPEIKNAEVKPSPEIQPEDKATNQDNKIFPNSSEQSFSSSKRKSVQSKGNKDTGKPKPKTIYEKALAGVMKPKPKSPNKKPQKVETEVVNSIITEHQEEFLQLKNTLKELQLKDAVSRSTIEKIQKENHNIEEEYKQKQNSLNKCTKIRNVDDRSITKQEEMLAKLKIEQKAMQTTDVKNTIDQYVNEHNELIEASVAIKQVKETPAIPLVDPLKK